MDSFIMNNAHGPRRVRLTREELLAGKCFPDEVEEERRMKADDIVVERLPLKPVSPLNIDGGVVNKHSQTAAELERCKQEIEDWKEYRERVEVWKNQMLAIVRQLKEDNAQKRALVEQIRNYRALLQLREEQIKALTQRLSSHPIQ